MKRQIEKNLITWKDNPNKKPLVLLGARQVGKTHSVMEFGKIHYKDTLIFNFETSRNLQAIFAAELEPKRIISALESYSLKSITPDTLIFFDEVQTCPGALTTLKYFEEQAPEYSIIAVGSLLGVAVNREGYSFPVGKVNRLTMFPMNFEEFLWALGEERLAEVIRESYLSDKPLSQNIHEQALGRYHLYLVTGGMPAVVKEYVDKRDLDYVRAVQHEILKDYDSDMVKYATKAESVKIRGVFDSIPSQLAKENHKFQYSMIGSGARAASYEIGLRWLSDAGLIHTCYKTNMGKIPLKSYKDLLSYKVYMGDTGLLGCASEIPTQMMQAGSFAGEAKGAITENYLMQQMTASGITPYYWESNSRAEIDFLIQEGEKVIPIEVKSAENTKAKSLKVFTNKYDIDFSIRVSAKNFGFENGIKSVPLYAAFCIGSLQLSNKFTKTATIL
jgi:predicted AAA+ superfamily ATPase